MSESKDAVTESRDLPRGLEGLRKLARDVYCDLWGVLFKDSESGWDVDADSKGSLGDTLSRLSDEIEAERPATTDAERRVLDMWPRYEDGEPVMVKDYALNDKDERFKVYRIQLTDGRWMLNDNPVLGHYKNGTSKTRVKRPEPDSWERLEDDAREFARDNQLPHDADQMERDALDLVRRAKALAGVE